MKKLARCNRERVLDVLMERLTFERSGVRLYDAIIARMELTPDLEVKKMLEPMREHRAQEQEHQEWLEQQIRDLNGDTNAKTAHARLVEQETHGIEQVIFDGENAISHLFHALYMAELSDVAGWDLLVELADEADDSDAKRAFKKRLREEEDHLTFMRRAMRRFVRREVLGEDVSLPTGP